MVNRFIGLFMGIVIVLTLHIISSGIRFLVEKIRDREMDIFDAEY